MTITQLVPAPRYQLTYAQTQHPDQHPALIYLASLAPGSRPTMRDALNTIAALVSAGQTDIVTLNWAALRYQHTAAIRSVLMERYAPATANKMLCALRRVLKEARRLRLIDSDAYATAVDLAPIKGERPPAAAGRSLSSGELRALMNICSSDATPAGMRDAALIAISYAAGLRRSEIISLDLEHFDRTTMTLTVKGKRNKTRTIPIDGGALEALLDWIRVRGEWPGALFIRILKGGRMMMERLTPQAIYHIQHQRAEAARVDRFSPHDLRRTFAGDLLDAGVDLPTVQKLMGHSNPAVTAAYDRRGEHVKRRAVRMLHVPYRSRSKDG